MVWFKIWRYWLICVSVFIIAFCLVMSLFNTTVVFAFFNTQINPVFWGAASVPSPDQAFQAWVYGAWGATVLGWGITMFFVAYFPFYQRESWTWYCILVSVVVWYLLDTGISWWFGVLVNVLLNSIILVLVLIPLFFTWREMSGK